MIRTMKTKERSRTVITIDGEPSRESVKAVEARCSPAESNRKPVYLSLRDVMTVDQAGRTLLHRLAAKGARLLVSGIYALCTGCNTWSRRHSDRGILCRDRTPIHATRRMR
jgi:ABC-type transporter Mla MlaB component